MKKLLSLAVVAAALCASVGCEDKKTTAPAGGKAGTGAPAGSSTKSGT